MKETFLMRLQTVAIVTALIIIGLPALLVVHLFIFSLVPVSILDLPVWLVTGVAPITRLRIKLEEMMI